MAEEKYIYLNRDLSWLSFNQRVLMEAADLGLPLYNRISFLSIFSSNLDEFFRVRMPSIYAFTSIEAKKTNLRAEYPAGLVQQVQQTVLSHQEEFGRILREEIIPGLRGQHVYLYYEEPVRSEHREPVREYFLSRVLSFLQPLLLQKENLAPVFLENNALYFLVDLESPAQPGKRQYALLNIPSSDLPRFFELPMLGDDHYLVFLDDVIRENIGEVFPGFTVHGLYSLKLTRDAEMNLEDEFAGDIAEKIEKQLEKRDAGGATRLLFDKTMPADIREFVLRHFQLFAEEMVEGGRYHHLRDLAGLPNPVGKKLVQPSLPSFTHPGFPPSRSVFSTIAEQEQMLHLPYHSYNAVLRYFNEAAIDPFVTEIYVTLYRVAANSHIVNALISAARNGKKVTVFVELKARFDEANNLKWSKKMKAAGVKIINSIPRLKVHAKVALVKRTEGGLTRYYSFLGTGNLNETTGRFYTDHALFTTHEEMGQELFLLFGYLQSRKQPGEFGKIPFRHLLVSQFNLVSGFKELIAREIAHAKAGLPAAITIKLNNLQEREMIKALYKASRAGVKVQLIVRSICCLAPGLPGQSEHITVRRLVDRYLEHARVFVFHNNGAPEYFMGSADWMNRNLHSRIEVCFPVYDASMRNQLQHILDLQLRDNRKAVLLLSEPETGAARNLRVLDEGNGPLAAQEAIYNYLKSGAGS